jgi:cleavage and polyadenylation specificity factor subunit 1
LIFFGTRLGNSLLLRLNEKAIIDPTSIDTIETMNGDENGNDFHEQTETTNEIPTNDSETDLIIPNNKNDIVYFASEFGTNESKKQSSTYSFEYCDHLINIGPCGYAIVGEGDSEETRLLHRHIPLQYQTTQLDLVTTSGNNKSGSVSILQQTIKPELITTQALPGSIDMWTVYSSTINNSEQKREHSFILISQETSTLIFQTGADIAELEQGGFLTNEQTIFCGNISEEFIVQITRLHIILLRDSTQIQIISYENNPIRFATSLDRYLAILTTHGVIYIYTLLQDNNEPAKLFEYYKLNDKKYTCINLYTDHSGLFTTTINNNLYSHSTIPNSPKNKTSQRTVVPLTSNPLDSAEFTGGDDEDEWLYGGKTIENPLVPEPMDSSTLPSTNNSIPINNNNTSSTNVIIPITHWLIAISKDGTLTMHKLMIDESIPPTMRFEIARFNSALKILVDTQDTTPPMTNYLGKIETTCSAFVYELLVIGLGSKKDRVYMIVRFFYFDFIFFSIINF